MNVAKWKQYIIDKEKKLSNKELLDEVLYLAQGDDYDGRFTEMGNWEYLYMVSKLKERLFDWLNSGDK